MGPAVSRPLRRQLNKLDLFLVLRTALPYKFLMRLAMPFKHFMLDLRSLSLVPSMVMFAFTTFAWENFVPIS